MNFLIIIYSCHLTFEYTHKIHIVCLEDKDIIKVPELQTENSFLNSIRPKMRFRILVVVLILFPTFFRYSIASNESGLNLNIVSESEFRLGPNQALSRSHEEGKCGFQNSTLKAGDKGYFTSPNYPLDYPPRQQCIWWLKVKMIEFELGKLLNQNI